MAGYKQFVDIQYCIKDPGGPARSKYAQARLEREQKKLKEAHKVTRISRTDSPPPKSKAASIAPIPSAHDASECITRKREKYNLPIAGRQRVHINTSGPVLKSTAGKENPTVSDAEHWENGITLGNKSIILIDKDEAMRKFKYQKDPTDDLIPGSLSHNTGKRGTKDPLFRTRYHTNTNGPVLNLNLRNVAPNTTTNGSLSAREKIVPDNGIVWDTRTAPDDVLQAVRHLRPTPDMSQEAFREMYKRNDNSTTGGRSRGKVFVVESGKARDIGVDISSAIVLASPQPTEA